MSIIDKIKGWIDWVNKEQDIIDHVTTMEEKIEALEYLLEIKEREERILTICPLVDGKKFSAVNLPDWYQEGDPKILGERLINYVRHEVSEARRAHEFN